MQEVARQAIGEYVEGHSRAELLERVLDVELSRLRRSAGAAWSVIYLTLPELVYIADRRLVERTLGT
jgi:hypothetical protein